MGNDGLEVILQLSVVVGLEERYVAALRQHAFCLLNLVSKGRRLLSALRYNHEQSPDSSLVSSVERPLSSR